MDQMTVFGNHGRDQRPSAQSHGVHPAAPPWGAHGNADGHDGGCCARGRVALAEGEDDVQGQQDARRRVGNAGDHADRQEPADGPDGQQLPVQAEIHRWVLSSAAGQRRNGPHRAGGYCAARLSLTSIESTRSPNNTFRLHSAWRPARGPGPRPHRVRPPGRAPPAVPVRRRRHRRGRPRPWWWPLPRREGPRGRGPRGCLRLRARSTAASSVSR
jgi:hypothetical protein